jgi:hypothetical protein
MNTLNNTNSSSKIEGIVDFLAPIYENLPKLPEGFSYYKLGQLVRPLTVIDDEGFWTLEYSHNSIKYIRPSHLSLDYRQCDVDYKSIEIAPIPPKSDLIRAYANGELASFINGTMRVGRLYIPEGYYREGSPENNNSCKRVFLDMRVSHFVVQEKGAASPNYILRELLSDYVVEQARQICRFRESNYLSNSDFFRIQIAVPSLEKQDEILEAERLLTKRFDRVLDVIDTYFDNDAKTDSRKTLLNIFSSISGITHIDPHHYFNPLRQILEWMFRAARREGLLHDKCFNKKDEINLTDSCRFMSGKPAMNCHVMCKKVHFPVIVADNVKYILNITGGGSHTTVVSEIEQANLTAYRAKIDSPYLLYSLTFMLCDIFIWFGQYVRENSDVERNKSFWKDLVLEGTLTKDTKGRLHVGDCFIPYSFHNEWGEGDYATVIRYKENEYKDSPYPLKADELR